MKLFHILFSKYGLTASALLIYLLIINRASYLSVYVQLLLMFFFWMVYKPRFSNRTGKWVALALFLFVEGLFNGNRLSDMLVDAVYLLPLAAVVVSSPRFREDYLHNQFAGLRRLLPFCLIAYYLIFTFMDYSWLGSQAGARFDYNQDTHLLLNAPLTPLLLIAPLLCISNFKGGWLQKVCLILGAVAICHFGFITLTKSTALGILIILGLRLVFNSSAKARIGYLVGLVVLSFAVVYVLNNYLYGMTDLFLEKFDMDNDSNTSRWEEGMTYLSQCNLWQILFGKGFGGLKTFYAGQDFIGGEAMLHMGWCYLIMKGGIMLLFIIYFPLLYIIFKDFKQKNYAYVIYAIYFLIVDQMHTTFVSLPMVYWIFVYLRYYDRRKYSEYITMSETNRG